MRLEEVEAPHPEDGQVRVRVGATSCNFADVLLCRGRYQQRPSLPFTPGLETCGVIDEVASGEASSLLGTRVVGNPILPHGGFAEYAILDAEKVYAVPPEIPGEVAATLHLTYLSAWLGLHRRAHLAAGDVVAVTAAAGGVGSAAVQVAVAAGAEVIAIVSGPEKAQTAAALGAHHVVDRSRDDVLETVRSIAPRGVDIVFDTAGGDAYDVATKYIAFEGRIVVVGFASGTIPQPKLSHAFVKNYTISGLHWSLYGDHRPDLVRRAQAEIFDLVRSANIAPQISTVAGIGSVPDALQDLADGRTQGKIVMAEQRSSLDGFLRTTLHR
ncbi:NADPH:quinone oxidoreductase family protein [Rhodococcus koreensis]|uniref:NADPH:quinone oxidoreductase family protein n=1 Tax=Rhodococcus koreensis TaxID=99653 RepID=UPI003670136A